MCVEKHKFKQLNLLLAPTRGCKIYYSQNNCIQLILDGQSQCSLSGCSPMFPLSEAIFLSFIRILHTHTYTLSLLLDSAVVRPQLTGSYLMLRPVSHTHTHTNSSSTVGWNHSAPYWLIAEHFSLGCSVTLTNTSPPIMQRDSQQQNIEANFTYYVVDWIIWKRKGPWLQWEKCCFSISSPSRLVSIFCLLTGALVVAVVQRGREGDFPLLFCRFLVLFLSLYYRLICLPL